MFILKPIFSKMKIKYLLSLDLNILFYINFSICSKCFRRGSSIASQDLMSCRLGTPRSPLGKSAWPAAAPTPLPLVAAPRSPAKPGDGRHRYVRGLDGVSRLFASSQVALRNEPTIAESLNTMDCRSHSAR